MEDRPMALPLPPRRGPRITLWGLRGTLTVHAGLVVAQPFLIGAYLDGDFGQLAAHRNNGTLLLPSTALLALVAALAYAVAGRGPLHPVPAVLTVLVAEGFQLAMGYARVLTIHLPLGILIIVAASVLAGWSWTPRASLPRPARRSPASQDADAGPEAPPQAAGGVRADAVPGGQP
jgi:hypothetical protein